MQFHQHVYGRVARGFRGNSPGFQPAALSDKVASRPELLEGLNRLSFFSLRGGRGDELRHSFFRPAEGFLAFGCCRLARDRSRSIGAFAHHFVCEEEEFLNSSVSPISLLRSLPFLGREQDLGDRQLPEIEFQPAEPVPSSGRWRDFALELLDFHLGDTGSFVPMVVAPDEDAWPILAELFALLPRLEASRLSFSTLFVGATEFLSGFQLVLVPDRRYLPAGTYVFRVFDPAEIPAESPKPTAFGDFWRRWEDLSPRLLAFVDALRLHTEEEAAALLPDLLALGEAFRAAVENLRSTDIYPLLLARSDWLVAYWRAGAPLPHDRLLSTLWQRPEVSLLPLLEALQRMHQNELHDRALHELACRIAAQEVGLGLFDACAQIDLAQRFYQVAVDRMELPQLQRLAVQLRQLQLYDYEIHETIARGVLREFVSRRVLVEPVVEWLQSERRFYGDRKHLWAMTGLASWAATRFRHDFTLQDYGLGDEHYRNLSRLAWSVANAGGLDVSRVVQASFDPRHRPRFLGFLARQLEGKELAQQLSLLAAAAKICTPRDGEHAPILEVIQLSEHAAKLARHYRHWLERTSVDQRMICAALEEIERRHRKSWFF